MNFPLMAEPDMIDTRPSRRERERQARRDEILAAARSIFAERGFANATLDHVAERAEFGKGTLYNYFSSKEQLFECVIGDSFAQMLEIAEESLRSGSFAEKIERFVSGQLGFFFRSPESMHLMMREAHHLEGENPMMRLLPQLVTLLGGTIAAEQQRGAVLGDAEPIDLATILINMIYGQFSARVFRELIRDKRERDQVGCMVMRMFSDKSESEIRREIVTATKLILAVYLHGIETPTQ